MNRVCRVCNNTKTLHDFGRNSRQKDGLMTTCKQCANATKRKQRSEPVHASDNKKLKLDLELERLNQLASQRTASNNYSVEQEGIDIVRNGLASYGIELKKWQDGTQSDIGLRTLNVDDWLPIQLKSSSKANFPYQFAKIGSDPPHDIIATTANKSGAYVFSKTYLKRSPVSQCGSLKIGQSSERNQRWLKWQSLAQWVHNRLKNGAGQPERLLRLQVPDDMQKEVLYIELSRMRDKHSLHEWPPRPNMVFDHIRDGQKEQFKSVYVAHASDHVFYTPNCSKRMTTGGKVAYELGDADIFCFCALYKGVFIEWRIPESTMDSIGMLSRRCDGKFVYPGKKGMTLRLPKDSRLQLEIFGKNWKSVEVDQTSKHVVLYEVPSSYVIDPVLCV